MGELLNQFSEYTASHKRLKTVDKWVYVELFKVFVDFLNDEGYELHYTGKDDGIRK